MDEKMIVKIPNEKGEMVDYEVLSVFDSDKTNKSYMIYTDNSLDNNGNKCVYAAIFIPDTKELKPIETEEEWKLVELILDELPIEASNNN